MVKALSATDNKAVAQAITEAEEHTSAELAIVVAAASDHYFSFVLLYGFTVGTLAAIGVWTYRPITEFPLLLAVQLGTLSLFALIHPLRRLMLCLVPRHLRHRRAAHRAFEEYLHVAQHLSAAAPIVLLYVSLAERYVHILPSRLVREKIPTASWEGVVSEFTATLPKHGLKNASIQAIARLADLLAPHFPYTGEAHHFRHPVMEPGKD